MVLPELFASGYQFLSKEEVESLAEWLQTVTELERADLRSTAVDAVCAFLESWPPLKPRWRPRTESKVRVLIYEDLQCPDCAEFRRMMDEKILPRYGERVAFIHRDFPLAKHAWARKAAIVHSHKH